MQHFKHLILTTLFLISSATLFSQDSLSNEVKIRRTIPSTDTFKIKSPFGLRLTSRRTTSVSDSLKPESISGGLRRITAKSEMPLFIINNLLITSEFNETTKFLNSESIADVLVYQKNDSVAKSYGDIAKNGLIVIKLKPNVKLLPLNVIVKDAFCGSYDSNLKVCIDGDFISHPEKIFVDPSDPYYFIKIIFGRYRIEGKEISSAEKFINVVTGSSK